MNSNSAPRRNGFGCLGYGCLIAVALMLVLVGALLFGARSAIRNAVKEFTTEQSLPVPSVSFDAAEESALNEKWHKTAELFSDPKGSGELVIMPDELQFYLKKVDLATICHVELQGDSFVASFSFPMSALGEWRAARVIIGDLLQRYVTGSAKAKVSAQDGIYSVDFEGLTLNGQVFDGDSMKEASEWVTGFVNSQGEGDDKGLFMGRISSLKVVDGALHVGVRPK
jgi:hypothetical protein